MIDASVFEHASMINVTQIQKIPENKTEYIREEIAELKMQFSKVMAKEEAIERKLMAQEHFFPVLHREIDNLKNELATKTS